MTLLPTRSRGIGAAVAGASALLAALGVGKGCGQSCIVASQNADQVGAAMEANLAAFRAGQIDRETALSNFDALWAALVSACGQIGGDAGRNCIRESARGRVQVERLQRAMLELVYRVS